MDYSNPIEGNWKNLGKEYGCTIAYVCVHYLCVVSFLSHLHLFQVEQETDLSKSSYD